MTPERRQKMTEVLHRRQHDLTIVLENVHDPHNISAVLRTADSVGIQEVHIVNTQQPRTPYLGHKSSGSAARWLTLHYYTTVDECLKALRSKGFRLMATHLGTTSVSLFELDLVQPTALIFGNEHDGISKACLAGCDGNFIIPQMGMVPSLNISVACAIALYEAHRQRHAAGLYNTTLMPEDRKALISNTAAQWGLAE